VGSAAQGSPREIVDLRQPNTPTATASIHSAAQRHGKCIEGGADPDSFEGHADADVLNPQPRVG
jgi:hypothetical protein